MPKHTLEKTHGRIELDGLHPAIARTVQQIFASSRRTAFHNDVAVISIPEVELRSRAYKVSKLNAVFHPTQNDGYPQLTFRESAYGRHLTGEELPSALASVSEVTDLLIAELHLYQVQSIEGGTFAVVNATANQVGAPISRGDVDSHSYGFGFSRRLRGERAPFDREDVIEALRDEFDRSLVEDFQRSSNLFHIAARAVVNSRAETNPGPITRAIADTVDGYLGIPEVDAGLRSWYRGFAADKAQESVRPKTFFYGSHFDATELLARASTATAEIAEGL